MSLQLPLGIQLRDSATFTNFQAAQNQQLLSALQDNQQTCVFFWGKAGTGKSHLLQALCHAQAEEDRRVAYLPLAEAGLMPVMLDDMDQFDLICVDDFQHVVGKEEWEIALFHLYNRIQSRAARLVINADQALASLTIGLPDLASRLGWGLVFQLQELSDEDKQTALQQRAQARGLEMNNEVAAYLLRHTPRNMKSLLALLDKLDRASLAAQRKLTIPFVREIV
ncbi:DnaA inactivator Hda (shorter homolog of DnaA) [hydrothermal vent metagenome]|uniref:DnaA inactivator Hda (Shorter homolog of DnaA) n=1 Tax=hydrothermal vent metagenome TaxID=652676 RepID=A0A3B1BKU5_9ZZZZ